MLLHVIKPMPKDVSLLSTLLAAASLGGNDPFMYHMRGMSKMRHAEKRAKNVPLDQKIECEKYADKMYQHRQTRQIRHVSVVREDGVFLLQLNQKNTDAFPVPIYRKFRTFLKWIRNADHIV